MTYVNLKDCFVEVIQELITPPAGLRFRMLPSFNTLLGGLREREFTILCGGTGTGKTTLLANLSTDFLLQQVPHFIASVETGHKDFVKRILSVLAEDNLNTGHPIAEEKILSVFNQYENFIKTSQAYLSLYDNRIDVQTLLGEIKAMIDNHGIKFAILDNINFFLDVVCAKDSVIEMDRVIHEFIMFCKQNPIHIIMVMHPRKPDAGNRVRNEYDIKGSSTAVQEAHNILLLNRPSDEMIDAGFATKYDREITLAKSRVYGMSVGQKYMLIGKRGVKYTDGKVYG